MDGTKSIMKLQSHFIIMNYFGEKVDFPSAIF